jgi:mRNA deadenylase 3'-5' endonuclease subunit Ccr4
MRFEVDKAKVDLISNLLPTRAVKEIRSFLGYAGFYRRFIQDFSKIARPLCKLLVKETPFIFDEDCKQAFGELKKIGKKYNLAPQTTSYFHFSSLMFKK